MAFSVHNFTSVNFTLTSFVRVWCRYSTCPCDPTLRPTAAQSRHWVRRSLQSTVCRQTRFCSLLFMGPSVSRLDRSTTHSLYLHWFLTTLIRLVLLPTKSVKIKRYPLIPLNGPWKTTKTSSVANLTLNFTSRLSLGVMAELLYHMDFWTTLSALKLVIGKQSYFTAVSEGWELWCNTLKQP